MKWEGRRTSYVCSLVDSWSLLRPHPGSLFLCCHPPLVLIFANPFPSKCHFLSCLCPFRSQVASLFLLSLKFPQGFFFYSGGGFWLKTINTWTLPSTAGLDVSIVPRESELSEEKLTRHASQRDVSQNTNMTSVSCFNVFFSSQHNLETDTIVVGKRKTFSHWWWNRGMS